jgi:uncharacterized protein involved in exopolysaccharide biosynthesis
VAVSRYIVAVSRYIHRVRQFSGRQFWTDNGWHEMNRNQQPRPEMTFRDVYLAGFRHRKKAIAVFLAVMTITVLITLVTPKAFRSQSKLFVRLGRENAMLGPAATLGAEPTVAVPMSRESEIASVAEMLSSRGILDRVVKEIGPELILDGLPEVADDAPAVSASAGFARWMEDAGSRAREGIDYAVGAARNLLSASDLQPHDLAVEELHERLKVEPVRNTNVVLVSFEAPQPELAQQVVASVVDAYLEQHVQLSRTPGTHEFFAEHAERLGAELKRREEELRELKTTTGLTSVEQQSSQIVSRLGRLEDELLAARATRDEMEAKVSALQRKLEELPENQVTETSSGIGNTGTDMIREQFFALQVEEKEASALYTADHPRLKMIREELAEAERILQEQDPTRTHVTTAPDASYEQTRLALDAETPLLAALQAKTKSLESQLAELRGSLEELNFNETLIAQLTREIELCDADYRKYATNLEQTRIDQAMETERMSNIAVAQPASREPRAIRPRKALNLALGFVAAVCGAFAISLLAEYTNHSLRTADEVERNLDLPSLATIPRMRPQALKVNGGK